MNRGENVYLYRVSQITSVAFHPVFMPLFGLIILYSAPTLLSYLPQKIKELSLLLVAFNNVLLPLAVTLILYSRGAIKSLFARERHERTLLLIITMLLWLVTTLMMLRLPVPEIIKAYFIATTIITFITVIISQFLKISLHSVGAGSLLALVCFIVYLFGVPVIWYLSGMIFLSGLVMFSRLYNYDHKPAEVWTGFFTGMASMIVSLFFLL